MYAHYLFQKHNLLPSEYLKLSTQEKAFLHSSVMLVIEEEKKQKRKAKSKARR